MKLSLTIQNATFEATDEHGKPLVEYRVEHLIFKGDVSQLLAEIERVAATAAKARHTPDL